MQNDGIAYDRDKALRILITTDNHLGYAEKDPIRGEDSFRSFEEALQIAVREKVDMILLGGDLFHENKPTRKCLYRCMELLRKYCLGDEPVSIEIKSDPASCFANKTVNFLDPNYNISMPVFIVHGNHDDPAGDGKDSYSALDILSVNNLVNYFGKVSNINEIDIHPVLIQKGNVRLALYGLGHIRDERLHRIFENKKVTLLQPAADPYNESAWFNAFVLHQNRPQHGLNARNFIPELMLKDIGALDLVVWGHEHESLIYPVENAAAKIAITQPGSTVVTSLSEGEEKPKHVGILNLLKPEGESTYKYKMDAIPLLTVRQFRIQTVVLKDESPVAGLGSAELVNAHLTHIVEELLLECQREREAVAARGGVEPPKPPLIRLKVEYSDHQPCNPQKFGQQFLGRVANPSEILLFYKKQSRGSAFNAAARRAKAHADNLCLHEQEGEEGEDGDDDYDHDRNVFENLKIEDFINQNLGRAASLGLLPQKGLTDAIELFVEKEETKAIEKFVLDQVNGAQKAIREALKKKRASGGGGGKGGRRRSKRADGDDGDDDDDGDGDGLAFDDDDAAAAAIVDENGNFVNLEEFFKHLRMALPTAYVSGCRFHSLTHCESKKNIALDRRTMQS